MNKMGIASISHSNQIWNTTASDKNAYNISATTTNNKISNVYNLPIINLKGISNSKSNICQEPASQKTAIIAAKVANSTPEGVLSQLNNNVIGHIGTLSSAYGLISNWGHNTIQGGAMSGTSIGAYVGSW